MSDFLLVVAGVIVGGLGGLVFVGMALVVLKRIVTELFE